MANDDALRDAVVDAAGRAGEAMWPMPLPDELRKGLDSAVADLANVAADRNGGMLVAGLFLREFVPGGVRWAHLDIAGPAFNDGAAHGYTPKGGTGAATRTLVQIALDAGGGTAASRARVLAAVGDRLIGARSVLWRTAAVPTTSSSSAAAAAATPARCAPPSSASASR